MQLGMEAISKNHPTPCIGAAGGLQLNWGWRKAKGARPLRTKRER